MIIPAGFAQLNAIHAGAAVPTGAQYTIGFDLQSYSGGPQDLAQLFELAVVASGLYANLANTVDLVAVLVKEGPNATGPSHLEPANQPSSGGTAGATAPAFLIHKNTDLGGRAGRGRMFLPGVPEASVNPGGVLASGVATAVTNDLQVLFSEMTAENAIPVVLHNLGSPITTPTPITSFVCDPVVATQRRRQRR